MTSLPLLIQAKETLGGGRQPPQRGALERGRDLTIYLSEGPDNGYRTSRSAGTSSIEKSMKKLVNRYSLWDLAMGQDLTHSIPRFLRPDG
ncbi:hypothetical protein CEXT_138171 [Caerostris extrusa]|uniref:Uncharacterized protein n=1 Tax=Caerostris extrusa TaxID=172846 RepID=A0AAV4QQM5_CAEEX|nr:hypothetical protein CEXT_138171 [Caerostris extrusa]